LHLAIHLRITGAAAKKKKKQKARYGGGGLALRSINRMERWEKQK
jgi:hypothetical protein